MAFVISMAVFSGICISYVAAAALPQNAATTSNTGGPVSWQSSFWALIPLALNSMTQPAGMVCFLPSHYGAILRCSPIICFIDTVIILEQIIWVSITKRSLSTGAKYFANFRFQDAESEDAANSFTELQNDTSVRVLLFIFGALPQFIKLYGLTGLFWTKIIGWTYLISFLVIEAINLAAWKAVMVERIPQPRGTTAVEEFIGYVSVVLSVLFAFFVFALGFIAKCEAYVLVFKWWQNLFFFLIVPVYAVTSLSQPRSKPFWDFVKFISLASAIILGLMGSATFGSEYGPIFPLVFLVKIIKVAVPNTILSIFAAMISAFITLTLVGFAANNVYHTLRTDARRSKFYKLAFPWVYITLYVDASLLYFAFAYNSEGTYKPAWADVLG